MLEHREFAWRGSHADLTALIAAHPWVTMVSDTSTGLTVSHLPVIPDPGSPGGPTVVGHLPVRDADQHELGLVETVLVVQGAHGYVSAGWYTPGPAVSTWNYVVAHLHGRPDVLDPKETFDVLWQTQDFFESRRPAPFGLDRVPAYARELAPRVAGFRLVPTRIDAKAKLSQDKPPADREAVIRALEDRHAAYANADLAAAMRAGGLAR